jgi:cell fate (sporulation/competence/biofilm development) regulator YlbF (YheA/YmcA/DUF963 family)
MSTDTAPAEGEQRIEDIAQSLGEAIADLPEYQQFLDAKEEVEQSEAAQAQIAEFESVQQEYLAKRERGEATREDLLELQEAQEQLHEVPVMSEYLQAENDLELRLQALNAHISDALALDFGEKAGGCCQD